MLGVALGVLIGCGGESDGEAPEPDVFDWGPLLPTADFPPPRVPDNNPMSLAKVELGRRLFYDRRLSGNETQACASCHEQARGFSDGLAVSQGSTGEITPRNSMTLGNVAYATTLTWGNPLLRTLEAQALVPMFGEDPVELGLAGRDGELLERLRQDSLYPEQFRRAFDDAEPVNISNIAKALAAFQRTLITF
ncbi:MAG: cytochrome c peroxidase, partial [Myxococcota bacterium]